MRRIFDLKTFWHRRVIVAAIVLPPLYNDSYVMAELVLFGIYFSINLMWSLVSARRVCTRSRHPPSSAPRPTPARGCRSTTVCRGGCTRRCDLAVGAVCGSLVALPAVRLRGVYFALLTIGLVEACNQYVTADTQNLGGAQGLVGSDSIIPPSKQGLVDGLLLRLRPRSA